MLCCTTSNPASGKDFASTQPDAAASAPLTSKMLRQQGKSHHSKAMYLSDLGRTTEAIEENRQAILSDPNNPGYQILMGGLLVDNGQLESALATYERVSTRFPDQAPYLDEVISQLRMGLNMLAIEKALSTAETPASSPKVKLDPEASPDGPDAAPPIQVEIIDPSKPSSNAVVSDQAVPEWLDPTGPPPKPSKLKAAGRFLLNVLANPSDL